MINIVPVCGARTQINHRHQRKSTEVIKGANNIFTIFGEGARRLIQLGEETYTLTPSFYVFMMF